MLTAWGAASVFGPMLTATLHDSSGNYRSGLHIIAGIMTISVLLPILVHPPRSHRNASSLISPPVSEL
jgi:OFA family oxalate/formate antiporter-like MFS transporter